MEPRRHRRGDSAADLANAEAEGASMEPRRHRRGDKALGSRWSSLVALQWSHDVTVVEMLDGYCDMAGNSTASMEPRRHRRGDRVFHGFIPFPSNRFNGATTSPSWRLCSG